MEKIVHFKFFKDVKTKKEMKFSMTSKTIKQIFQVYNFIIFKIFGLIFHVIFAMKNKLLQLISSSQMERESNIEIRFGVLKDH